MLHDPSHDLLTTLVVSLWAGIILTLVSRRYGFPAIVALLTGGVVLGPSVVGIVQPALLGSDGLRVLVSMAIGLILFEGGLTLDLAGRGSAPAMITRLLTVGVLVTWLSTSLVIWLVAGLPPSYAIISGSLVIVTGPTVIAPLLRRMRLESRPASILRWEGVLIDPIGVFIAVLCFEWIGRNTGSAALWDLGLRVAAGLTVGGIGALAMNRLLRGDWIPEEAVNMFTLTSALLIFWSADMVRSEAGLLSVTAAGLGLGILGPPQLRSIRHFKEGLTDVLIGMLFILLSARLELEQFATFGRPGILALVIVLVAVRPLSIWLCSRGLDLPWRERAFLSWVAPRGIVAASMGSLFAIRLEAIGGVGDPRFVETFTYSVIVSTVLVQGMTAAPLARALGLVRPPPEGWLVIGGHELGRSFAGFVERVTGRPAVVVDTNPRNARACREVGLTVLEADARDAELADALELRDVGHMIALTDNEDLNERLCRIWGERLGRRNTYRARLDSAAGPAAPSHDDAAGRVVWTGLPRPTILSAEMARARAALEVRHLEGETAPLGASQTRLARFDGSSVDLSGEPDDPPGEDVPEGTVDLVLHFERAVGRLHFDTQLVTSSPTRSPHDLLVALAEKSGLDPARLDDDILVPVGAGLAIAHTDHEGYAMPTMAFGLAPDGLEHATPDRRDISIVVLLLSPASSSRDHLAALSSLAHLLSDDRVQQLLHSAQDESGLREAIVELRSWE